MAFACNSIVCICRADVDPRQGRHRRRQFQSGYGDPDRGRPGNGISQISQKSWLFLILSGLATGASWLCYYKALQMGDASKVVPIDKLSVVITLLLAFFFLHEQFTVKSLIGCVLIGTGTLLMVL